MRALVGREKCDVGAEQPDRAGIGPQVAADLAEQRCLAGAVRADDQPAFARLYREGNVVRNRKAAERLLQVDDFKGAICFQGTPRDPLRNAVASVPRPGTIPVGITRAMNRNTRPSSMFQRSI